MPANTYEITYIANGVLGDDQIRNLIGRVTKFIEQEGGKIVEVDEWGSQRLAYSIDKKRTGYYVNAYFEAEGELIARLERMLTLEDDILRFLTLKMDAVMLRHREERKKEMARKQEEAEAEALAPKEEAPAEVPVAKEEAPAEAPVAKEEAPADAPAPKEEAPAEVPATKEEAPTEASAPKEEAPAEVPAPKEEAPAEASAPKEEAPAEASAPKEEAKAADRE